MGTGRCENSHTLEEMIFVAYVNMDLTYARADRIRILYRMYYAECKLADDTEFRAAVTVLLKSIAMVIGPTPPGTGVIQEAFSLTDSKSTSPTNLPDCLLVPTSITTALSLIISLLRINLFLSPTAVTIISDCNKRRFKSTDFEWHIVTVASRASISKAKGFPTRMDLFTIIAF